LFNLDHNVDPVLANSVVVSKTEEKPGKLPEFRFRELTNNDPSLSSTDEQQDTSYHGNNSNNKQVVIIQRNQQQEQQNQQVVVNLNKN